MVICIKVMGVHLLFCKNGLVTYYTNISLECFASSTTCNTATDPNPSQVSSYEDCCMNGGSYNHVEGDDSCRTCTRSCKQLCVICYTAY